MKILQRRRKVCPECGWPDTRPSTQRSSLDYFLMAFLIFPYRCRSCGERFWGFGRSTVPAKVDGGPAEVRKHVKTAILSLDDTAETSPAVQERKKG